MARGKNTHFYVLLVQNDPDISYLITKSLEENPSFPSVVDRASCIQEALAKLKRHCYHLLLVESDLHGEKGLSLIDEVRRRSLNLPFILMTSVRDEQLFEEAKKKGVSDFLVKSESNFQTFPERLRESHLRFCESIQKVQKQKRNKNRKRTRRAHPVILRRVDEDMPWLKDQLTELYSHSFLHDRLAVEFKESKRLGYSISCLMLDMDSFKSVNEKWGHRVGDDVLRMAAKMIMNNCRLSDIVARYGGEEFAVLMSHSGYEAARELGYRLRSIFAEHVFFPEDYRIHVTVSIGIASFPEDLFENYSDLFNAAQQALFRAKATGRNSIMLHKEILPVIGADLPVLKIGEGKVVEFQRKMSEVATMARQAYIDASKTLIKALETKDAFTVGHATRCARYSRHVAEVIGMSVDESEVIEHAALLHDVGKICIPDSVLLKPGRLNFDEFDAMKQHAYFGYKILKPIKFLQEEARLVLHHHEWFNGEGYPSRLKGRDIPLGSRIIAIVDAYDTMRNAGGRYRKTVSIEEAVRDLVACSGTQFDPDVVKAFIEMLHMYGALRRDSYDVRWLEKTIEENKAA